MHLSRELEANGAAPKPRCRAELALRFVLPPKDRSEKIGDLVQEADERIKPLYGPRWAAAWLWVQAVREVPWTVWLLLSGWATSAWNAIGKLIS